MAGVPPVGPAADVAGAGEDREVDAGDGAAVDELADAVEGADAAVAEEDDEAWEAPASGADAGRPDDETGTTTALGSVGCPPGRFPVEAEAEPVDPAEVWAAALGEPHPVSAMLAARMPVAMAMPIRAGRFTGNAERWICFRSLCRSWCPVIMFLLCHLGDAAGLPQDGLAVLSFRPFGRLQPKGQPFQTDRAAVCLVLSVARLRRVSGRCC